MYHVVCALHRAFRSSRVRWRGVIACAVVIEWVMIELRMSQVAVRPPVPSVRFPTTLLSSSRAELWASPASNGL